MRTQVFSELQGVLSIVGNSNLVPLQFQEHGEAFRCVTVVIGITSTTTADGECTMFLAVPESSDATERIYKSNADSLGFVMNLTRAWAWRPDVYEAFAPFGLG